MKRRFAREALDDLAAIYDYIAEHDSPERAARVIAVLDAFCAAIAEQPRWGMIHPEVPDIRYRYVRKTGHFVYYSVDDLADEVVILNVDSDRQRRRFTR